MSPILQSTPSCTNTNNNVSSSLAQKKERKYLLGGNWKCNGTVASAKELISILNNAGPLPPNAEVVIAPPFLHIPLALSTLRQDIQVAAQNCGANAQCGAYTGEICAHQLKDAGVSWVIVGHSERRHGFGGEKGEDHELVAQKLKVGIDAGLKVMFCIGETQEERERGVTMEVIEAQLLPAAKLLREEDWYQVALAYEPVWAIGTGVTATPELAQETHGKIRHWMTKNVSEKVSQATRIQYGGSMKGSNAAKLLVQPDIDGGLIGSASLKPDFVSCIHAVPKM